MEETNSQSFDSNEDLNISESSSADNDFITSCLVDEPEQLVNFKMWSHDSIHSDYETDNIFMEIKDNYYEWSLE